MGDGMEVISPLRQTPIFHRVVLPDALEKVQYLVWSLGLSSSSSLSALNIRCLLLVVAEDRHPGKVRSGPRYPFLGDGKVASPKMSVVAKATIIRCYIVIVYNAYL